MANNEDNRVFMLVNERFSLKGHAHLLSLLQL